MNRKFAIIVGAALLIVGAFAASFAFLGSSPDSTRGGSGVTPAHTMSDGTTMTSPMSSASTGDTNGSHEMPDGSTMGGMDMGN